MKSLGGCPPWAVLHDMIDAADSDRNGEVIYLKNNHKKKVEVIIWKIKVHSK